MPKIDWDTLGMDATEYFRDAEKRERSADERAKLVAQAHRDGWQAVARAIDNGFRLIAEALRERR